MKKEVKITGGISNKQFWTLMGFIIMLWCLIFPNLPRALIGITIFVIGTLMEGEK